MDRIIRLYNHFSQDSLYRNSIYLMLSTAIMALLGFFFWILCAHVFSPEQVGIATTLISVMTLISTFSILGLGNSIIKYLPTSDRKNDNVNTSLTLVGVTAIIISVFYLVLLDIFSPKLLFIRGNIVFSVFFIVFIALSSLNIIFENIFIAHRSSLYVLIKNTIFSVVKLAFPVALISLGSYGIFMSVGLAVTAALVFSVIVFITKFNYSFKPNIHRDIIKKMAKFSLGNYAAGFIGALPSSVLPILILNSMGAKFSAYFYMDMMIASLLFVIPLSVSQSLFAEGSYSEGELKGHLKKAIRLISVILLPSILIACLFGRYILLAFGKQYSSDGMTLLQILSVSTVFLSINYLGSAIFYIKHKIKQIILINAIGTSVTLLLCYVLSHQSLVGIGVGWIAGSAIVSGLYVSEGVRNRVIS